jgi:transcriptional regulator with XRE-family HTH domain
VNAPENPLTLKTLRHKKRQMAILRGEATHLVPAEPVRAHLMNLRRKYGLSLKNIADLAGLADASIVAIYYPNHHEYRDRVRSTTAQAILAVTLDVDRLPDTARITATGTARRIQALSAKGWTQSYVARRLGMLPGNLRMICRKPYVSIATYKAVAQLYNELWNTEGPSDMARSVAARNGWPVPMAWDDETIDDPDAEPYGAGVDKHRSPDEALELHRDHGLSVELIAERLGIKPDSVEKAIKRALQREEGAA